MVYQGNKNKYVKYLLPIIISCLTKDMYYVEPFCGSCSILQHVRGKRIANDKNKYLIAMWRSLVARNRMPMTIEKDFYYDVRESFRTGDGRYGDDIIGWVGYMGSFKGRFFDGGYSGHKVAVKEGFRDYITENMSNTLKQVPYLDGVDFRNCDYTELEIPKNSVIYADPPYKDTLQYQYSKDFNHDEFYEWCRKMVDNGNTVLVSEYNMPCDFECIWQKDVVCTMGQATSKNSVEKLFVLCKQGQGRFCKKALF